jgi:hypothetical protein
MFSVSTMSPRSTAHRRALRFGTATVAAAAIALNLLQACTFKRSDGIQTPEDVYAIIDAAPYVAPLEQERWVVVDEPGKLHVEHGRSCARASQAASETHMGMRITESVRLPKNYVGTVFQNGYELRYEDGDHEVVGLGSAIYNVHLLNDILFWDAGGVISDREGEDDYRWCYAYTVVAWPRPPLIPPIAVPLVPRLDIEAVHANRDAALIFTGGGNALAAIRGKYKSEGKKPRALALAGFAATLGDEHAVLQFGFDLGAPRASGKNLRWRSQVVLKDDDAHFVNAAELVSVLGGESVHVFQPQQARVEAGYGSPSTVTNDIKLKARGPSSCGAALGSPAVKVREMAVTTPPFRWAMPMLTGWDLRERCDDEHKRHVGAWIDDFSYTRRPGDPFGTLRYTVVTTFGDADPFGFIDGVQIDVLGIDTIDPVLDPGSTTSPGRRR